MTFYLKYRPQNVDELDLREVREQLGRILKSKQPPHAFLFSGPKGSGKTSAARILAKVVNCEKLSAGSIRPCNKCKQCRAINSASNLDVIELDAASHRGIDDIRALRDAVKLAPASALKKVYIIDEAHMLTTEAANALLKTLEEPPEHVIFVLATTNPEKLPETIVSRTTNVLFKRATTEEIVRSLSRIVNKEKIKADKKTLEMIANSAGGSFRDAVKTLEHLTLDTRILKLDKVSQYLHLGKSVESSKLLRLLSQKQTRQAIEEVERAVSEGVTMVNYVTSLLEQLRLSLLAKSGIGKDELDLFSQEDLLSLIQLFSESARDLTNAVIEQLPLEVAIVQWCSTDGIEEKAAPAEFTVKNNFKKTKNEVPKTETLEVKAMPKGKKLTKMSEESWTKILASVRTVNTSIEALLRATRPVGFDGATLKLDVFYRFHKERLEDVRHMKILEQVVTTVVGSPVKVICILAEPPKKQVEKPSSAEVVLTEGEDTDIINVAKEIFGN